MTKIEFGYWSRRYRLKTEHIKVCPLPQIDLVINNIEKSERVAGPWFHPPLQPLHGQNHDPNAQAEATAYTLPATHSIEVNPADRSEEEFSSFIIVLIGLLSGIRLLPSTWNHFYRAAVKPGTLTDLVCTEKEIESVLVDAERFWQTHNDAKIRKGIFGAIHWLLFAQSYRHEFEQFSATYTVLDTCYKIRCDLHGKPQKKLLHFERPAFLASSYSMPVPEWATTKPSNKPTFCDLSVLRNDLIHEARYAGEPIGFAHAQITPPITLQLTDFCSRLIIGILGVDCDYVRTPVDTRAMHPLGLRK